MSLFKLRQETDSEGRRRSTTVEARDGPWRSGTDIGGQRRAGVQWRTVNVIDGQWCQRQTMGSGTDSGGQTEMEVRDGQKRSETDRRVRDGQWGSETDSIGQKRTAGVRDEQ